MAKLLFKIDDVKSVLLTKDFITITKTDNKEWPQIKPKVYETITNFYQTELPVMNKNLKPNKDTQLEESDDEVIIAIKELIETRIRPMVQEDGGDVTFVRFTDGIVYLKLMGVLIFF